MTTSAADDKVITEAKARFTRCQDYEAQARERAMMDTKFANGDSYNLYQWPAEARTDRAEHVCLTNNKVRQHNLHIVNDARQHKAAIKVTPTGGGASYEAAQVYSAIIRRIEYQSKAMDAYSTAIYHQVESGIGYCRVTTDYESSDSFNQEIYIRRIRDPRTVFLDPDAHEYDKADMRFAFVFIDTPRKEFEAKYPGQETGATLDYGDAWDSKEHVREAEYWRRSDAQDKLHLLSDGSTIKDSELPDGAKALLDIQQTRDITTDTVEWFKLAGGKIVDRKTWPGKYIPIVPFIGEETVIDGVMDRKGHTRALLDAQRMYNYWSSAATEQVALQGKSPFVLPVRSVEGLETYWDSANRVNHAYLPYNDRDLDTGQEIARPERAQPPVMAQAYMQGMESAKQDMMMVSGQYQAEMGAPGNERSGVAIQQRQREGDTATYHYIDNQAKGIRQIGRIVLDLIPRIYDVARVIKIMAMDGTQSDVHLDPSADAAHQQVMPPETPGQPGQPVTPQQADRAQQDPDSPDPTVIFNPTVGTYDIEADVGPSFGTQREEAFNAIQQVIQASPDLVHVAGDLLFKSADFPLADELAVRLKRGVPQQYLGGPAPATLQIQQQMQHMQEAAQHTLQQADAEIGQLKAQLADKAAGHELDNYRAETDRMKAVGAIDPEALRPVVRELVSQALGTPIVPVMQAHAQAMMPAPQAQPGQPDPSAQPDPNAQPQPQPGQPGESQYA